MSTGYIICLSCMGNDKQICIDAKNSRDRFDDGCSGDDVERMIEMMMRNKHWTPFALQSLKIKARMPIFVARQWMRHSVGIVTIEKSMRYVSDKVVLEDIYIPPTAYDSAVKRQHEGAIQLYNDMVDFGVSSEKARTVLPVGLYSTLVQTMSLEAAIRIIRLRSSKHAQMEIQEYANKLFDIIKENFPVTAKYIK